MTKIGKLETIYGSRSFPRAQICKDWSPGTGVLRGRKLQLTYIALHTGLCQVKDKGFRKEEGLKIFKTDRKRQKKI
jgi:hypothetical protein